MPITWRNVEAPDVRGALLGLTAANQSFNAGFDKIGEVLKQREQMATDNWNQQKVNNTQLALDELRKYRTPEEYQAAMQSGELDRLTQGMGAQVDAAAVRNAEETRLPFLQQRVVAENAFNAAKDAEADRPIQDQIAAAVANNDPILAAALTAELRRGKGAAMQSIDARQQVLLDRERVGKEFDMKVSDQRMQEALHPLQLDQLRAATEHSRVATEELKGTRAAAIDKAETERARAERLALRTKVAEGGEFALGEVNSKEGYKMINDHLASKLVNPDDVPLIQEELGKLNQKPILGSDGRPLPIPTRYVLEAIQSMGDRGYTGRWGNQIEDQVRARVLKNQDKIRQDQADLLKLDFTDATRPIPQTAELVPPKKTAPTNAPTEALDTAAKKVAPPPVVREKPPEIMPEEAIIEGAAEAKATREKLEADLASVRNSVGRYDKKTPEYYAKRNQLEQELYAARKKEEDFNNQRRLNTTIQRRLADQEEARKNSRGR